MSSRRGRRADRSGNAFHSLKRSWFRAGIIVLGGLLTYGNSLSVPFHFDDEIAVVKNNQIRHLWPLSQALSPPNQGEPVAGRPLANLSFAINYAVGGLHPEGYHVANIALHVLCALVLFGIVRRTIRLAEPVLRQDLADDFALVCALIWLLHPLQTGVATYISGRTESLMGLFYFLTIYCGIRALAPRRSVVWNAMAVLCCGLGMASKESMVTAPVMMVLYDRAFIFDSLRAALRTRRGLYGGLAVTWLGLAALAGTGPRSDSAGFFAGIDAWTYLLNQSIMIVHYLRLAIWPHALVFDYGEPIPVTLGAVVPHASLVVGLMVITLVLWRARPAVGFAGVWFLVTLAPTSSFVPIATEVGADRRMYLPLAGLVVLFVALARWSWERASSALGDHALPPRAARVSMALGALLLSGTLAAVTIGRNTEYASGLTLWRTVVDRWPSPRAHRNLAAQLKAAGYRDEVLDHLRRTVDAHPEARYALGAELLEQGRSDQAIGELEAFIRWSQDPNLVAAARQLVGQALASEGKHREAVDQFRLILEAYPADPRARVALADVLYAQGNFEEAIRQYQEFLRVNPGNAHAWDSVGVAQFRADRNDEAIRSFRRALELDPGNGSAHRNLASALLIAEDIESAKHHAEQALRIGASDAGAHYLLGLVAGAEGNLEDAIKHFKACLSLDPGNVDAQKRLAAAEALSAAPQASDQTALRAEREPPGREAPQSGR